MGRGFLTKKVRCGNTLSEADIPIGDAPPVTSVADPTLLGVAVEEGPIVAMISDG